MRRDLIGCVTGLALAFGGAGAAAGQEARLAQIACPVEAKPCCSFDATAARPIEPLKLGFQLWPLDLSRIIPQAVALNPRITRFSLGPYPRDRPPLPLDADYEAMREHVRQGLAKDEAKWREAAVAQEKLAAASGPVEHVLIIWEPPLTTLDSLDLRVRGSRREVRPEAVTVHARFYVAAIEAARRLGFRIDAVEIANEPDGAWNMLIPPGIYVELLEATRREAAAANVELPRLAGPGLAFLNSLKTYLGDAATARRMLAALDIVSAHAWDDRLGKDILTEARDARKLLDDLGWKKPIMISEFAPTYPLTEDRAAKRGPDQRKRAGDGGLLVSDLPRYAPSTSELALALAATGFNPLIYWELMDPSWGTVSYGLLDSHGRPRPAYAAWKTLAGLAASRPIDRVAPDRWLGMKAVGLFTGERLSGLSLQNKEMSAFGVRFGGALSSSEAMQGGGGVASNDNVPRAARCGDGAGMILPPGTGSLVPIGP
jgi:hypothetical protein